MEPIEHIDKIFEQYQEAFEKATTQKEQEKVDKTFEPLIAEAEKKMGEAFEERFKKEEAALLKEQKDAEFPVEPTEVEDSHVLVEEGETDVCVIKDPFVGLTKEEMKKQFEVYELKTKCKQLGIKKFSKWRESKLVDLIFDKINEK